MVLASLPATALVLSFVGLAAVAVDPRTRRRTILPAVSAAACVIGSAGLLIAVGIRESIAATLAAGLVLGTIPLVLLALARVLPTWSGPRSFPIRWWRVVYSGGNIGLGLFAALLSIPSGPSAIGSVSERTDPVIAASVLLLSLLPQIACGRGGFAAIWGGTGGIAAAVLAAILIPGVGMGIDTAAAAGWIIGVTSLNVTRPCIAPPPTESSSGIAALDSWRVAATASVVGFATFMGILFDWAVRRFG
jgi:hypothetical protein